MSTYLGFIALVPRRVAHEWAERHTPPLATPVLQAFASDAAWNGDHLLFPARGNRLELNLGGVTYTVWQYCSEVYPIRSGDMLAVARRYANEGLAPGGKFSADVELHQGEDVTLIEIVEGDLDKQIKRALFGA